MFGKSTDQLSYFVFCNNSIFCIFILNYSSLTVNVVMSKSNRTEQGREKYINTGFFFKKKKFFFFSYEINYFYSKDKEFFEFFLFSFTNIEFYPVLLNFRR